MRNNRRQLVGFDVMGHNYCFLVLCNTMSWQSDLYYTYLSHNCVSYFSCSISSQDGIASKMSNESNVLSYQWRRKWCNPSWVILMWPMCSDCSMTNHCPVTRSNSNTFREKHNSTKMLTYEIRTTLCTCKYFTNMNTIGCKTQSVTYCIISIVVDLLSTAYTFINILQKGKKSFVYKFPLIKVLTLTQFLSW